MSPFHAFADGGSPLSVAPPEATRSSGEEAGSRALLVLGIGNILLCDEGAGVHAMRHLERACANLAGVDFVDGGTLSFTLASLIEASAGLIVFDAAEMNATPGSVGVFEGARMDEFLGSERKRSVHEVGLLDLMALAALGGRLPVHRALIGIQPQRIDWGDKPSLAVAAAIPRACERASELLSRFARSRGGET